MANKLSMNFEDYVNGNKKQALQTFNKFQYMIKEQDVLKINGGLSIFNKPGIIDHSMAIKIAEESKQLQALIIKFFKLYFGNNMEKIHYELGINKKSLELMKSTIYDDLYLMSRCDVLYNIETEEYKILEFNIDSSIGGLEIAAVNKLMMQFDFYNDFFTTEYYFLDPLATFCDMIKTIDDKMTGKIKTIAVIDWDEYMDGYLWSLNLIKDYLTDAGYNVIICNQKAVYEKNNFLYVGEERIDLVYRVFIGNDAIEAPDDVKDLYKVYEAGNILLINGLHTELYSNKLVFALMQLAENEKFFNKAEIELIKKITPETKILDISDSNLIKTLLEDKENYILKPSNGYGGKGIIAGWKTSKSDWKKIIHTVGKSQEKYIVQKRVKITSEKSPFVINENKLLFKNLIVNWGIYLFDGKFSGLLYRGMETNQSDIINAAQGAGLGAVFIKK